MKNYLYLLVIMIVSSCQKVEPTIESPDNFTKLSEVNGDIDSDIDIEKCIIYNTDVKTELGFERKLYVYDLVDNKWVIKSITNIIPSEQGGLGNDPLQDITISGKSIVLTHSGGSNDRWSYTHTFSLKDNKLVLKELYITEMYRGEFTYTRYNPLTGRLLVESEDDDTTIVISDKMIEKRIISMDGFTIDLIKRGDI